MVEQKLGRTQKFFSKIFPVSWGRSMEADSRQWMVRCSSCEFERSIWDLGGIRWKAAGRQKTLMTCPNCQHFGGHTVYKKEQPVKI